MSVIDVPLRVDHWLVAGGIGVYVAGVTWFARREASQSDRLHLALSTLLMIAGLAMLAAFPAWSQRPILVGAAVPRSEWYVWTAVMGLLIVWRCLWAIMDPRPVRVQTAVGLCVLSIVMLDAFICLAVGHVLGAGLILLLLLPAMFLGRWIAVT
jgi:4-hydroxybenzoate polyprenyltransferase